MAIISSGNRTEYCRMNNMKNIIVIAYQLNPYKGSECSVAWDYVVNMSKTNRLTVIFGSSEEFHMIGNTKSMMDYINKNPLDNVKLLPISLDEDYKLNDYSALGIFLFYKQYKRWHRKVQRVILDICDKEKIDLIHYLGPIGYREPGYAYKLGLPYIWGPIGGFGGINIKLIKATCSISGAVTLILKRFADLVWQNFSHRVSEAINSADIVIGATTEYADIIKNIGKNSNVVVKYLPENCMKVYYPVNLAKFDSDKLKLIWIGSVDSRKGLILLLEALSKLPKKELVQLEIVGTGALEPKLKTWVNKHGLSEFVHWNGNVKRERVFSLLNKSHLNVITSLHDANTTVLWEAMSMGVPTMSLDHCGMHDIITGETGIKIPIRSYKQVVCDICEKLQMMIDNPKLRRTMADAVIENRNQYTWKYRTQFFEKVYDLAINNRNAKQ